MDQNQANSSVESDVLHIENHSRLTPEEIAKALAHHKKHHHDEPAQSAAGASAKSKGKTK